MSSNAATARSAAKSRIEIDWTRCDGHGLCAALLPNSISRDEWGFPVIDAASISEANARVLASVCPALALRVVKDKG